MKTKDEILVELKDRYGFSTTDTKWLPSGSSIIEYIGTEVLIINFSRDDKNNWTNTMTSGKIHSLEDFEPTTGTYLCKYSTKEMEEGVWKEVRIIPEGFELIAPDSNQMVRFVPYSIHSKMMETESFYQKLFVIQAKSTTLDLKELKTVSDSKDQENILGYYHNIGAVVKTEDNNILWFRIKSINVKHLHGTVYTIILTTWDNKRYTLNEISSTDSEYKFVVEHQEVGKLKIIDLARSLK